MTQPPYGQGADPYQNPQPGAGGGSPAQPTGPETPASPDSPTQSGYGPPTQGGYGSPPPSGFAGGAPQYGTAQPGYPGAPSGYGAPQAPKSKTGLIIAAVVGVLAIAGVVLAVVLLNKVPDPAPLVQGDDPALNQLAQSCFDGEMSACDDLFLQSPVDSELEAYGNTCGGRVDESDVDQRYCVDIF